MALELLANGPHGGRRSLRVYLGLNLESAYHACTARTTKRRSALWLRLVGGAVIQVLECLDQERYVPVFLVVNAVSIARTYRPELSGGLRCQHTGIGPEVDLDIGLHCLDRPFRIGAAIGGTLPHQPGPDYD